MRLPRLLQSRPAAVVRGLLLALCAAAALAACQRAEGPGAPVVASAPAAAARPAARPVEAVTVLRDRLLARDGAGFARLAVPPALHARLQAGWRAGTTRWPLDELPLDGRLPRMLAALQAPGAQAALMATFRRQFAGADRDIDQAVRTLVLFGGEYVAKEAAYTDEERDHVAQAIRALGDWALAAPLSDPARAERFFTALTAAATRSGIDGKAGKAAYVALGMEPTLARLSPFLATLIAQLRQQYGLDLDASLRGLDVRLLAQTGDTARLRLRYPLAGRPIDAVVPAVRIDGHWYLADFVARAEASLAPPGGADRPASP
jgi:hypothetical protein